MRTSISHLFIYSNLFPYIPFRYIPWEWKEPHSLYILRHLHFDTTNSRLERVHKNHMSVTTSVYQFSIFLEVLNIFLLLVHRKWYLWTHWTYRWTLTQTNFDDSGSEDYCIVECDAMQSGGYYQNKCCQIPVILTLILLMWRIGWAPNNASRWQMGFNLAFKGL